MTLAPGRAARRRLSTARKSLASGDVCFRCVETPLRSIRGYGQPRPGLRVPGGQTSWDVAYETWPTSVAKINSLGEPSNSFVYRCSTNFSAAYTAVGRLPLRAFLLAYS